MAAMILNSLCVMMHPPVLPCLVALSCNEKGAPAVAGGAPSASLASTLECKVIARGQQAGSPRAERALRTSSSTREMADIVQDQVGRLVDIAARLHQHPPDVLLCATVPDRRAVDTPPR